MPEVKFGLVTEVDLPEYSQVLLQIWDGIKQYYSPVAQVEAENLTQKVLKKKLEDPNSLLIAGKIDSKIVAARLAEFECNTLFLCLSGILDSYQRQGIGLKLHYYTFAYLRAFHPNVHKVWCDTVVKNEAGIAILEKLGFKKEAELKNHWYGDDYFLWGYLLK